MIKIHDTTGRNETEIKKQKQKTAGIIDNASPIMGVMPVEKHFQIKMVQTTYLRKYLFHFCNKCQARY